ncbi:unnamed protein product [Paramecium sonneborni]|uniref:Uncharacterized protein n=1 Tax=Paramecium sonneborni TaxID=65129 RepID=A0A8S1KS47_9CILI|nr:unnamed protein product [Paramecium sonneborni]
MDQDVFNFLTLESIFNRMMLLIVNDQHFNKISNQYIIITNFISRVRLLLSTCCLIKEFRNQQNIDTPAFLFNQNRIKKFRQSNEYLKSTTYALERFGPNLSLKYHKQRNMTEWMSQKYICSLYHFSCIIITKIQRTQKQIIKRIFILLSILIESQEQYRKLLNQKKKRCSSYHFFNSEMLELVISDKIFLETILNKA